jgi:glycosyltransferase involved in cell wall biosynthesis
VKYLRRLQRKKTKSLSIPFENIEGYKNYNFSISNNKKEGTSALMRVKDEGDKITDALSSIYDVFDQIVVVNNASTDDTHECIREFISRFDRDQKIQYYFYPFEIALLGDESNRTDEYSVHNLTYLSNFGLSQCEFSYINKWDGDMFLRGEIKEQYQEFLKTAVKSAKCWQISGQTVYRSLSGDFFIDPQAIYFEVQVIPNDGSVYFRKNGIFESINYVSEGANIFDDVVFYEMKYCDREEFSHWSTRNFPTQRKTREWKVFNAVREGRWEDVGLERIAPEIIFGNT